MARFRLVIVRLFEAAQDGQQFIVFRNIAHRLTVMDIASDPAPVNDDLRRHPAEFEQADFLPKSFKNSMLGIWQAGEGQFVPLPIILEALGRFRPNHQDFRFGSLEFRIVEAQLRQVRAAVGSGEAAVEHQDDLL